MTAPTPGLIADVRRDVAALLDARRDADAWHRTSLIADPAARRAAWNAEVYAWRDRRDRRKAARDRRRQAAVNAAEADAARAAACPRCFATHAGGPDAC